MGFDQYDNGYNPQDTGRTQNLDALADGAYTFEVLSAELATTEKTGEDILRWKYKVVSGHSLVGGVIEHVNFFRSQQAVNLLGADLMLLGIPTQTWTVANGKPFSKMLRQWLPEMKGMLFNANKVTVTKDGRQYHNLRIRGLASDIAPMPENMPF